MSQVGSLSSFTYAGMAGLSLASFFGVLKLWKHWFIRRDERISKDADLQALRLSLDEARSDAQVKEEAMSLLRKELENARKQLDVVGRLLEGARTQNQALGEQVKQQGEALQLLRHETLQVKEEYARTLKLLEARTQELKGAEAFLTKADVLSGAEVLSMLNTLNSEVYQTAALVAESFQFRPKRTGADEGQGDRAEGEGEETEEMAEVYASTTDILGPRMMELLKSSEHHDDPTLIQIAFQAGMSAYSNWIISSWYFEDPDDERLLDEIYGRVREAEEQAVSGRWRALTRAHVQQLNSNHEPDLAMYFIDAFVNILLTAGVTDTRSELQEAIASRFADRVGVVVKSAQRLRKAIGEEVTSCDFEVIYIAHDSPFDPPRMDDSLAGAFEERRGEAEPVLCTTDLGLGRLVRAAGRVGEWEQNVLLRPKIALESGIDELMSIGSS
ncbi:hypothetical protein Hypma_012266 [Hypsizygus marmoreus]|uniref:Uncharacterized protein n=1 Tax=Hypsizygus marmoreus TaxID=39966 RepID=A0A369JEU9_HYPMA|nr:hypothetical protein Hypma_012266 [Hypsizygus marmoreus]